VPGTQGDDINVALLISEMRGEFREKFARLEERLPALDKRVGELEANQAWVIRGIVGTIIAALAGLVGLGRAKGLA
jgi:hypothetical protein